MTEPPWDYPLRAAKPVFVTWYVMAHLGVSAMLFIGGAWSGRGSQFGLGDPVTRSVLPGFAVVLLVVFAGLLVLVAKRPAAASLSLDRGTLLVPRSWLSPRIREIPLESLRSAAVLHTPFGRRLILETSSFFGVQCASWWFASGDAIDRIHARIEVSLLARAPNEAERSRVVLQSRLSARASSAWPLIGAAVTWLVGCYAVESWFGNVFDVLHLTAMGANATWLTRAGEVWRTVSAAALHLGPAHVAANLIAILALTPQCYAVVGAPGCILVFGIGAISGATATALIHSVVSVGASPGLFGMLGAWLFWGLACGGRVAMPFGASARVAALLLFFALAQKVALPNTDGTAHFFGALGGAVAAWALTGRALRNVGVARSGRAIRLAATGMAALFIFVPAWSFARGALADPVVVASHAIAVLTERDLKDGGGIRSGLELCFSPRTTRAQIEGARSKLTLVPTHVVLAKSWVFMTGCFEHRRGNFEPAWRMLRGAQWLQGNALAGPIIASIAHESAEVGSLPWTAGSEAKVDLEISSNAREIEIRRRERGPGGMGVDFMVHSDSVVMVVSAWLPESSLRFSYSFEDACGVVLEPGAEATLIDVIDGPGAAPGHTGRSRCAAIPHGDVLAVASSQP